MIMQAESTTLDAQLRETAVTSRVAELEHDDYHAATFWHADGSASVTLYDQDGSYANPRDNDGNIARLVQDNSRMIELDETDAGMGEARDRWDWTDYGRTVEDAIYRLPTMADRALYAAGRAELVRRYVAMFRPDIALYVDEWHAAGSGQGDESYGWGYVTTADAAEQLGDTSPATVLDAFDAEVSAFGLWASGEVFGAIHVETGGPIVAYGAHGAYVTGYTVEEDSVWGFLGYDNLAEIAAEMTSSPIA